jgi:hypothetical protein
MIIAEMLYWNSQSTERDRPGSQLNLSPPQFTDDPRTFANAFTRRGLVKHFWNPDRSGEQPSGHAPPDPKTELIPSGTLEPTAASWEADPAETEVKSVGRRPRRAAAHDPCD